METTWRYKRSTYGQRIVRSLIGLTTALIGGANMFSMIIPYSDVSPVPWSFLPHKSSATTVTIVLGFFLITLSYGLVRGKKHAWLMTMVLLLLSTIVDMMHRHSMLEAAVTLLLTGVLCLASRFFQAKSDPPSTRKGYMALFLGWGIVIFYIVGGFILLDTAFELWVQQIGHVGTMMRVLHGSLSLPHGTQVFFFAKALPFLCGSAILYGMVEIFRPVAAVLMPASEAREQARELTQRYGTNSISYWALSENRSYFFSSSQQSMISYVLQGSTAVVTGDPIGPDHDMMTVLHEFLAFCDRQDWTIVFWQVRAELSALYRNEGLRLLKIGEDAILVPPTFTLTGSRMGNVRTQVKRAAKDGLQVVFYRGTVSNIGYATQMERISQRWLMAKGGSEMGFSMGRFDLSDHADQLYALVIDVAQTVQAFASFIPIYGRHGWGIDLMRRDEQCSPGTMDLLITRSIEHLKNEGALLLSSGLAPMSNANQEEGTFITSRLDVFASLFGNPAKNQSLFFFKKKFNPTWESRYLVYSEALDLPKVGLALYKAHAPQDSVSYALSHGVRNWLHNQAERRQKLAREVGTAKV